MHGVVRACGRFCAVPRSRFCVAGGCLLTQSEGPISEFLYVVDGCWMPGQWCGCVGVWVLGHGT